MLAASEYASSVPAQSIVQRFPAGDLARFFSSAKNMTVQHGANENKALQRILILEEDGPLARLLAKGILAEHVAVDIVRDEAETLAQLGKKEYNVVILSLDMSNASALQVVRGVRSMCPSAGILVLGRQGNMREMVKVLDQGADDCMPKPFSLLELTARVRALQRRTRAVIQATPKSSDVVLNRTQFRVERSGRSIDLTPREFALLEYMVKNAGQALSRATLMQAVWNMAEDANTNIVDVYMKYLRDKLDCDEEESLIRTVRGVGYVLSSACTYSTVAATA